MNDHIAIKSYIEMLALLFVSALSIPLRGDPEPTTPWPTSKSGTPEVWMIIVVCAAAFVILLCVTTFWSWIVKHPETERISTEFRPYTSGQV